MLDLIAFHSYFRYNNTNLTLVTINPLLLFLQKKILCTVNAFRSLDAKHYVLYFIHLAFNDFLIGIVLEQEQKFYSCICEMPDWNQDCWEKHQ